MRRIIAVSAPEWQPQVVNPGGQTYDGIVDPDGTIVGADGIRRDAKTGEVIVFQTEAGSLGDWLKREEGQIDLRPTSVAVPEPIAPGMFDMVSDAIQGAVADALDPLELAHGAESGKGALHDTMSQFGKSFGNLAGAAVIGVVIYLIVKFESTH